MRRLALFAGMLLLVPLTAAAAETNLYDVFRKQVEKEYGEKTVDQPVIEFLQLVYKNRWGMRPQEIQAAIRGKPWLACAVEDSSFDPESPNARNVAECDRALRNIQLLSEEEQNLRVFGRQLLRMSAAQELPLTEFPGRPFHLATDLSGIINIWRAGTGSVQNTVTGAMLLRTRPLTDDEVDRIREAWEDVAGAARGRAGSGQNEEYTNGLIWYFQYGARLRAGARSPEYPPPINDGRSGPGTERQYLFHRDYDTTAGVFLTALWNRLPKGPGAFDPPLSKNEVAYVLFPDELTNMLPENIVVWARIDGGTYEPGVGESYPLGDVGYAWKYPVEPLLPSLLSTEYEPGVGDGTKPILGGRYPPEPANPRSSNDDGSPAGPDAKEPIDGRGLCSMAVAQRGYLCRPLTVTSEERCPPTDGQSGENVITLVSCRLEGPPKLTVAGADVCQDIEWRNDIQSASEQCTVPAGMNSEYELVKIQQRCIMKVDNPYAGKSEKEQDALCCRLEGEAHLVACKPLAVDGVLRTGEDNVPLVIDGIPVTTKVCMEIHRLKSCRETLGRDVRCPVTSELLTADDAIKITDPDNPENGANRPIDPDRPLRVAARIRAITRHFPVCTPGTESTYKNTIGNNACYIGQCVEETLELHRLTAGRSPAVVGDGAFPHDDPSTGDALAKMLRSVPTSSPPLPSYRPQMVMRTLEDALCQLQGLPAATPPHLCAFAPSRRLELPFSDGATTARSIIYNADEQRDATALTEQIASALGSRIGTDMQGQYLRIGTKTLSEVVALANTLLQEANTVTFPTDMCPLSL